MVDKKESVGRYPKCGKCDWADHLMMSNDTYEDVEKELAKTDVYINGIGPLRMSKFEEAIPYFPYIVAVMVSDKQHTVVHLSKEAFIDTEEKERVYWKKERIEKYFKWAKRNKQEPTYKAFSEWNKNWEWSEFDPDKIYETLFKRKLANPKDTAYARGIHTAFHTHYRKELLEYAEKFGVQNHPIMRDYRYKIAEYENQIK